jgi:amino acid permease
MAIATMVGTIVGAGILGIPYVIAKAGFLYGLLLIIGIGIAFIYLNLFAGEVVLRTKEQHQLTGYAEKYLGKRGKKILTISLLISIYGALTAYLIGEGATMHAIFSVGSPILYTIIFFLIATFIIYRGMKATGKAELFLIGLLLITVVLIGVFSYTQVKTTNFSSFDYHYLFLPYGVILFALMGLPAIPEVQEVLNSEKKKMKKVILIGSIIPIILYLLFTVVIIGIVGEDHFDLLEPNDRIATIALKMYSLPLLGTFANMLAVLAMFTSFLSLGTALTEIYRYDYGFSKNISFFLTFSIPLLIFFFQLTSFIAILGVTGAVAGGIDAILIILMYWKAKTIGDRKPEYQLAQHKILGIVLILMFAVGILYQLWINFF